MNPERSQYLDEKVSRREVRWDNFLKRFEAAYVNGWRGDLENGKRVQASWAGLERGLGEDFYREIEEGSTLALDDSKSGNLA